MPAHSHRPVVTPPNRNDSPSTTDPIVHGITTRVGIDRHPVAALARLDGKRQRGEEDAYDEQRDDDDVRLVQRRHPREPQNDAHSSIRDNAASSSVANLRGYPVAREAMNDSCSSASTSCASKLTVVVNAGNGMSNVM